MYINAAVVFKPAGEFKIENLEISEPCDDEVLVRIASTGICHTDLAARDQHFPTPLPGVFGHEGAGVIEKIGNKNRKRNKSNILFSDDPFIIFIIFFDVLVIS